MPYFKIFFENQKSVGGYEYVDKTFIREKNPRAAKETVKFNEQTLQVALRQVRAWAELFSSNQHPNLCKQKIIDFYNAYGPLTGDIQTWVKQGGPPGYNDMDTVRETGRLVDERIPCPGEPQMIFGVLALAPSAPVSRYMTTRVIEVTDGEGNVVPHIEPRDLWQALLLTSKFPSENTWVTCEYFKKYGHARLRRKGNCPPNCIIQTDGRRAWGDGCSEADRKERRKAEQKKKEKEAKK